MNYFCHMNSTYLFPEHIELCFMISIQVINRCLACFVFKYFFVNLLIIHIIKLVFLNISLCILYLQIDIM